MGPVLAMHSVVRTFTHSGGEVHALRGFDMSVAEGELVALMGPSGSGKSTLLQVAGGLDRPTAGGVSIEGFGEVVGAPPRRLAELRRRHVGYVFQDYNLVPALTVLENVALPLELDGARGSRLRRASEEALERVGMARFRDRYPEVLSGGERQRVAIARALVGTRRLVLADEPTGALDSEMAGQVMALVRRRVDDGGSALVVTHDPAVARWANRVVGIRDGRPVDPAAGTRPVRPGGPSPTGR